MVQNGLIPAQLLRQAYLERKEGNSRYSTRAFARDLGISQTLLSLVMNEKRSLSPRLALRVGALLGLKESALDRFAGLAARSTLKPLPARSAREPFIDYEAEIFETLSQWYNLAILDLTQTKEFKSDAVWIARRLGIEPVQARESIHRMLKLGLLRKEGTELIKNRSCIYFGSQAKKPNPAIRVFLKQMIKKAQDHFELADPDSFSKRDISGIVISVNPQQLSKVRAKIRKFQDEMTRLLGRGDAEEVYQLNVQLFPLTRAVKPSIQKTKTLRKEELS